MVRKEIIYVTKEDIQMPGLWVRDRSITCGSFGKCLRFPVTKKESFESLRLPLDKNSCTRQFESKLSLRSFAKSLAKGSFFENLPVLPYLFSKTYPSFLTLKEGSTSHLDLLPSGKKRETAPPRRSEPLRSKVGGASKPSPYFAGWDRLIIAC